MYETDNPREETLEQAEFGIKQTTRIIQLHLLLLFDR